MISRVSRIASIRSLETTNATVPAVPANGDAPVSFGALDHLGRLVL